MYFTYIIESQSTARWYYGHTDNIDRRIHEHNTNHTKSTKNKGPWKIIFIRSFPIRQGACNFEFKLKKSRNKAFIRNQYQDFFIEDDTVT